MSNDGPRQTVPPICGGSAVICVECGTDAPRLIDGACPRCFVKQAPLLTAPGVLDLEVCAHCDARHVGAHWIDPDEGEPLEWIREQATRAALSVHPRVESALLQLDETPQDEKHFQYRVHLSGEVDGADVQADAEVLVRMRKGVCDRCSRMFGGYYAAIIQLRATDRDVTEIELERAHRLIGAELDRLRSSGNREAFLTKSGPVPGGFDYYLGDIEGTRTIARFVADRLGGHVEEHAKLAGRKEGNDIYRVTFRLRIRLFAPGDFALYKDEPVQFVSGERGRAVAMHLKDHKKTKMGAEELRRLGGAEILQEAVVVSADAGHIQLLDPVDYRTVDVPRPEGFKVEGQNAWVLRHEERLYLPALPVVFPKGPKGPPRRPMPQAQ